MTSPGNARKTSIRQQQNPRMILVLCRPLARGALFVFFRYTGTDEEKTKIIGWCLMGIRSCSVSCTDVRGARTPSR